MTKPFLPAIAVLLLMGMVTSQAQTTDKPHGRHKQPEPEQAAAPPAPPPIAEWFGNAVGDILTGADKALGLPPPNQPAPTR